VIGKIDLFHPFLAAEVRLVNDPRAAFTGCLSNPSMLDPSLGDAAMADDEKRSKVGRRSGKDRRSGVDTRTEREKKAVGERRSTIDRRSGFDRRSATAPARSSD
jgi:hypothetical protein